MVQFGSSSWASQQSFSRSWVDGKRVWWRDATDVLRDGRVERTTGGDVCQVRYADRGIMVRAFLPLHRLYVSERCPLV